MHAKKTLFILSQAPYVNSLSQTALDNIFAHASLECACTIVFCDKGRDQLNPDVKSESAKSISKQLSALPLYDVNDIFVLGDVADNSILTGSLSSIDINQMRQLAETSDIIYHY